MRKLASLAVPLLAFALAFACAPAALAASPADILQAQGLMAQDEGDDAGDTGDDGDEYGPADLTLKGSSFTYTGKEIKPDFTVAFEGKTYSRSDGKEVTNSDFEGLDDDELVKKLFDLVGENTFIYMYENNINVNDTKASGEYQPTVSVLAATEEDFYDAEGYFSIKKAPISSATFSKVKNQAYTGKKIDPEITATFNGVKLARGTGSKGDYSVTYKNNVNAGTATAVVSGNGNFTGTKNITFKITQVAISKASFSSIKSQTYTGKQIKPEVTVKYNGKKLKKGTNYTVTYKNNVKVGTKAKVVITGKGNFKGKKTLTFTIKQASIKDATFSNISNKTYTGSALTPNLTVKLNGKKLKKGTDYTLKYSNNTNAGIAAIKVTGKGNMKGSRTVDFVIDPRSLSSVSVSVGSATWTGGFVSPNVTLKYKGKTLKSGTDYTATYSNNVEVGTNTGQVYLSGMRNFTGSKTSSFSITRRYISDSSVSAWMSASVYQPNSRPTPLVTYNGRYLTWGVDYTLNWSESGTKGVVTIYGTGHFQGTRTLTYGVFSSKPSTTQK